MLKEKQWLSVSVLALLIMAVWVIYDKHGSINIDGVLYLRQANFFLQGKFEEAGAVFRWPFFGFFIAQLSKITGLPLIYSAQLINISAFVVACFFSLKTMMLITQERHILLAGPIVIATSTSIVDSYLPMLLRDNGMWAGLMMGTYFYLKWLDKPSMSNTIFFQSAFLFGALFRVELLIIVIAIFLASPWIRPSELSRRKAVLMASLAIAFLLMIAGLYAGYHMYIQASSINWGRMGELFDRPLKILTGILSPLPITVVDAPRGLLKLVIHHGLALKLMFLSYAATYKWIATVGLLHLVTAYVAVTRGLIERRFFKPILLIFATSLAIAVVNFPHDYIIPKRYLVMNLWVVYLASGVGLAYLIRQLFGGELSRRVWLKASLITLMLGYLAVVLIDKPRNTINPDTITWIREHNVNLDRAYIRNIRLCFYLDRFDCGDSLNIEEAKAAGYEFLVIDFKSYEKISVFEGYKIVKRVPEREHPEYVIYKKQ